MSILSLSNLQLRPNLLSNDYQSEMYQCSVFEIRDISRRNSDLVDPSRLSLSQNKDFQGSLFWGNRKVRLTEDGRQPGWLEVLTGRMDDAIRHLEERPVLEDAWELLIVARQLYRDRAEGKSRRAAAEWDRRVCAVLARDEFRLTQDVITQRLEGILGEPLPAPELGAVTFPGLQERTVSILATPRLPTIEPQPSSAPGESAVARRGPILPAADPVTKPAPAVTPPLPVTGPPANGVTVPSEAVRTGPSSKAGPRPETTGNSLSPAPLSADVTHAANRREPQRITDPDLVRLARRWPSLPEHVKKC